MDDLNRNRMNEYFIITHNNNLNLIVRIVVKGRAAVAEYIGVNLKNLHKNDKYKVSRFLDLKSDKLWVMTEDLGVDNYAAVEKLTADPEV